MTARTGRRVEVAQVEARVARRGSGLEDGEDEVLQGGPTRVSARLRTSREKSWRTHTLSFELHRALLGLAEVSSSRADGAGLRRREQRAGRGSACALCAAIAEEWVDAPSRALRRWPCPSSCPSLLLGERLRAWHSSRRGGHGVGTVQRGRIELLCACTLRKERERWRAESSAVVGLGRRRREPTSRAKLATQVPIWPTRLLALQRSTRLAKARIASARRARPRPPLALALAGSLERGPGGDLCTNRERVTPPARERGHRGIRKIQRLGVSVKEGRSGSVCGRPQQAGGCEGTCGSWQGVREGALGGRDRAPGRAT